MKPSRRFHRRRSGLTFTEVMFATAIFFTGAVVMITVLPQIISAGNKRASQDSAYLLATSKIDELQASAYSSIAASASGNFNSLLSGMSDISGYSWSYTSTEEIPGVLKKVNLVVTWSGNSDSYVFYKTDMNDD